jgi:hypothetical protein
MVAQSVMTLCNEWRAWEFDGTDVGGMCEQCFGAAIIQEAKGDK